MYEYESSPPQLCVFLGMASIVSLIATVLSFTPWSHSLSSYYFSACSDSTFRHCTVYSAVETAAVYKPIA
jgi:hypothetical protein